MAPHAKEGFTPRCLARVCDMEVLRSVLSWANLREMMRPVRESLYDARREGRRRKRMWMRRRVLMLARMTRDGTGG